MTTRRDRDYYQRSLVDPFLCVPRRGDPLTGSRLMLGAMRATERCRGLLVLFDPRLAGQFRVAHQIGFGADDLARIQVVLGVVRDAIDSRTQQVRVGDALRPDRPGTGLGAVTAFPILAHGRVIAAFAVEDPRQLMPPDGASLLRVAETLASMDPSVLGAAAG